MEHLDQLGLEYLPGSATFYLFVSIADSTLSSEEFCTRLLTERHVCAVPGIGYGESCDGFIRISVGHGVRGADAPRAPGDQRPGPRDGRRRRLVRS